MEVAALLAVGLSDWIDFGVIVGILMLNAFVGYYQERQAADIVASLKGDIAMRCTVVRDSNQQEILARELVPGDIVSLFTTRLAQDLTALTWHSSSSRKVTLLLQTLVSSAITLVPRTSKCTNASELRIS
jgi:hypothetical protein